MTKYIKKKTGKWIYPSDVAGFGRCSECKALWDYLLITNKFFKICPKCGSYNKNEDMEELRCIEEYQIDTGNLNFLKQKKMLRNGSIKKVIRL